MKTIGYFTLAITVLASCGQAAPNAKNVAKADTSGLSSPTPALPNEAELHRYANTTSHFFDTVFSGHFNGSVLVAKDGQILYERYKGFRNPRTRKDSLDAHTSFHLASVSKTFTAMAILKLWEDGKLDIHDEVSKYLQGFPYKGLTLQNLLTHRSGLRNYVHFMDRSGWDKRKFLTNTDVLQYIIAHPTEVQGAQPNRHFEYSNTNYALLALIIEKVFVMNSG